MRKASKLLFFVSLMMVFYLGNLNIYGSYFQQDQSKGIEPYLKKRPPQKVSAGTPVTPKPKRSYRFVKIKKSVGPRNSDNNNAGRNGGKKPPAPKMENAALGFTMWRFQPATSDNVTKGLTEVVQQTGNPQQAQRIEADTPLAVGDFVRLQIESLSHDGYLYIINREKFADGTYGEAKLVFPTQNSMTGNYVKAGVLNFVPAYPNVFRVTTDTERKQVADELTIIVSPKPLVDPTLIRQGQLTIPTDNLIGWVNKWEVDEVQRELDGGAGQVISLAEQIAVKDQSKGLTEV